MKNIATYCTHLCTFLLALSIFVPNTMAGEKEQKYSASNSVQQAKEISAYSIPLTIININNITSFYRADGSGNNTNQLSAGLTYPRETATAIYQDGFVWGGKVYIDGAYSVPSSQIVRVGGQTYNQGTRQGVVTGWGVTAAPMDPNDPHARAYRIRRDYYFMTESELRADAATLFLVSQASVTQTQIDSVWALYALDWTEWPVSLGAPYIERNGIPGYQAPPTFSLTFTPDSLKSGHYDEPGIAGGNVNAPADQVIWTAFNDLDTTAVFRLYQSKSLGLECQVTLWGYKSTAELGNMYFKKLKMINKGGVNDGSGKTSFYIDSMYISQWSDPDLGDSGDDLVGCDTLLNLGFTYNGQAIDSRYHSYSLPPPSIGYDILQGPVIPSAGDSATWNFRKIYNNKNLPMTSFTFFSSGSPISDPKLYGLPGASYESTLQWYRLLRGLLPDVSTVPERFYSFPTGITPGPYTLSGNPVTGTGFVDGAGTSYSFVMGDRRMVLSCGPFRLAPSDTQEVVIATIGGNGADRLSSVSVMKSYANSARSFYSNLSNPVTGIDDKLNEFSIHPNMYELNQNYPNPFNPSTSIPFYLPKRSVVRLSIYNVLGQEIETLVDGVLDAGSQSITWNSRTASGVYFYKLEATSADRQSEHFISTRKMILMK